MNEVLARLEKIYRQQLDIYDEVLELADAALAVARDAGPLSRLNAILARKQQLLAEIDRLDALAAPDRLWSRDQGRSTAEASQLRQPLSQVALRIEQILDREREMERWILLQREEGADLRASSEAGD
jgi:hypothetical protein